LPSSKRVHNILFLVSSKNNLNVFFFEQKQNALSRSSMVGHDGCWCESNQAMRSDGKGRKMVE